MGENHRNKREFRKHLKMGIGTKIVAKVLPDSSAAKHYYANGILHLVGINNASEVDGEAFVISNCYLDVFGMRRKNADDSKKRLSIMKISANGKSIYRECRCVSATSFNSDYVALSPHSIMLLNDKNGDNPQTVNLSEGSRIPFYWLHPDKAVRLSFKLGLVSLLLGVISIAISILGLMKC